MWNSFSISRYTNARSQLRSIKNYLRTIIFCIPTCAICRASKKITDAWSRENENSYESPSRWLVFLLFLYNFDIFGQYYKLILIDSPVTEIQFFIRTINKLSKVSLSLSTSNNSTLKKYYSKYTTRRWKNFIFRTRGTERAFFVTNNASNVRVYGDIGDLRTTNRVTLFEKFTTQRVFSVHIRNW